jgi:hypothetical protein
VPAVTAHGQLGLEVDHAAEAAVHVLVGPDAGDVAGGPVERDGHRRRLLVPGVRAAQQALDVAAVGGRAGQERARLGERDRVVGGGRRLRRGSGADEQRGQACHEPPRTAHPRIVDGMR